MILSLCIMADAAVHLVLRDADPTGIVYATRDNWTGRAVALPVGDFEQLRHLFAGIGVYVLQGVVEGEDDLPIIYVGESERISGRLTPSHGQFKNDSAVWHRVVVFTSTSDDLHKGHVKWLESELIRLAKEASRAALANSVTPPLPKLPEHDSVFVSTFLSNMLVLYPLLGIDSFTPPTVRGGAGSDPDPIKLHASLGGEIIASGLYAEDGFVLLAGSKIKKESTESLHGPAKRQRQVLKDNEQLADFSNEYWELLSNVELPTSSTAAQLVYGRSASGPESWRTTDGVRLKDLVV
jgi:hypothetical protein